MTFWRGRLRLWRAWWAARSLRGKIAVELAILGLCALIFVVSFPQRTVLVDLPLALGAWGLIGLNASYTREVIWVRGRPNDLARRNGVRPLLAATVPAMALFLLTGAWIGYQHGGWTAVAQRLFPGQLVPAFAVYFLWALVQQTLFQFYLLGRLHRLFPVLPPALLCAANGLAFSLVHWPSPLLMALTAAAGTLWSYSYFHHGRLWPIALSHAALGATFYYWVCGRDLGSIWLALVNR